MKRPVIGLSTYREDARWGVWHGPATLTPAAYVDKIAAAGGLPVLLPPRPGCSEEDADQLLDRLDGLVLIGGADIAPSRYAEQRHPSVQAPRPDRDDLELMLARRARARDLPTLGICRGMQVMAVAAGGTLVQHLPDKVGDTSHAHAAGTYGTHAVFIARHHRLNALLGDRLDSVPTYHHQAVLSCPGLVKTAWAADGTLEALEDPDCSFYVGVQWHPEVADDQRLFQGLVSAAGAGS